MSKSNITLPKYCPNCGIVLIDPNNQDSYYSPLRLLPLEREQYNRFECTSCQKKFCYHEHGGS